MICGGHSFVLLDPRSSQQQVIGDSSINNIESSSYTLGSVVQLRLMLNNGEQSTVSET